MGNSECAKSLPGFCWKSCMQQRLSESFGKNSNFICYEQYITIIFSKCGISEILHAFRRKILRIVARSAVCID